MWIKKNPVRVKVRVRVCIRDRVRVRVRDRIIRRPSCSKTILFEDHLQGGRRVVFSDRYKARIACTEPKKRRREYKRGEKKVKRVRTRRTEEEKTHFQVLGWGRRIWGR